MNIKKSIFNDCKMYYFVSLILLAYMLYFAYISVFIIFIPIIFKLILSIFTLSLISPNLTEQEMNLLNYDIIFMITYFSIIIGIPLSFLFIFIKNLRRKSIKLIIFVSTLVFISIILINPQYLLIYLLYICILVLSLKALSTDKKYQEIMLVNRKKYNNK